MTEQDAGAIDSSGEEVVEGQGLRILFVGNLSEERFEVGVVPASLLSFGAEASR